MIEVQQNVNSVKVKIGGDEVWAEVIDGALHITVVEDGITVEVYAADEQQED
jgi:hypothetical protein